MVKTRFFLPLLLLLFIALGCKKKGGDDPPADNFDRAAMLANWADNLIIPGYEAFVPKTEALVVAADSFVENPIQANLDILRTVWYDAYLEWQRVSMYEIGKAEEITLRDMLNIYPTDVIELEKNIAQGGYDLELPDQVDRQGFPALDYMLYGLGATDLDILNKYTSDPNATNYRSYLMELIGRINALCEEVLTDWKSGYRDQFVANSGSSANASVDRMVNDFVFYYEKNLRAGKIGIPAGVFSGSPLKTHVEAPYRADICKLLLDEALNASQNFFNGKYANSSLTGESLKSYLDYLGTIKGGDDLSGLINAQFEVARTTASALDDSFAQQIDTDNTLMLATFDQLQLNVVLLKVDMMQAMNISVDYVDADGD